MNILLKVCYFILIFMSISSASAIEETTKNYTGKKILYIDSYHLEYPWSAGILQGVKNALKHTGVKLKTVHMDTKRYRSEVFKVRAGLDVKQLIDNYQPDIVIASDDNASKYLIQPYYKNAALPFVFCGVNWDASAYGYPYDNVTGMIEVGLIKALLAQLSGYAKGQRLGVLSIDSFSERKVITHYKEVFGIKISEEYYVSTFEEWKQKYIQLQSQVDQIILESTKGIPDWDEQEAIKFVKKHTTIPTGTMNAWMMPVAMMGYVKIPEEQGEWAANAALKILAGHAPRSIPLARNTQGKLMINIEVSTQAHITFSLPILKVAEIIH